MSVKYYTFISIVLGAAIVVSSYGMNKMLGPGVWSIIKSEKCEDDDQYLNKLSLDRRRLNRSHVAFDGTLGLMQAVDETFGMRLEACKYVDGGCKPFQKVLDDCFCCFMKKYEGNNFINLLVGFGLDPPDCPIPAGDYTIENFTFDYDSLPDDGLYGEFLGHVYLLKDGVPVGCASFTAEFTERTN